RFLDGHADRDRSERSDHPTSSDAVRRWDPGGYDHLSPCASLAVPARRRPGSSSIIEPRFATQRGDGEWPMTSARGGQSISHTGAGDRKSTRLNSSHVSISYAVFGLKKKHTDT